MMALFSRNMKRWFEYIVVTAGLTAVIGLVTWPHALVFGHSVVSHIDPLFSMWRLAWFTQALTTGAPIADGNMFFPEPGTFLLSDATLLQGAMAYPALRAGLSQPLVYNALLAAGMVSSGLALYHVARTFEVVPPAAFAGAVIFTVAPFRIEHVMHLELQWVAPALMAGVALHRLLTSPGWRPAIALGAWMALQFLACVYYSLFVVPLFALLVVAAFGQMPRLRATAGYGVLAMVLAVALASPAAALYFRQSGLVAPRTVDEVGYYSVKPINFLAAPSENLLYGSTAATWGGDERRLFPGVLAIVAAAVGLRSRRRLIKWAGLLIVVAAATLSLGVNGPYRILYEYVSGWQSFRVPARFGIYVLAGIAILAALGVEWLLSRSALRPLAALIAVAILVAALCAEYRSPPSAFIRVDVTPPVYEFLARAPEGVVLELPFSAPLLERAKRPGLVAYEADYIYWSTRHWRPLVNGYSGYHPPSYQRTIEALAEFPDATSMAHLAAARVRYLLIHATYYPPDSVGRIVDQLLRYPDVRSLGTYHDWAGPTHVVELAPKP